MTNITVPIKVENLEKLSEQLELAKIGGADMVELRLDYWNEPETLWHKVKEIVSEASKYNFGIIATCRAEWEGGMYDGDEELRMKILQSASTAGADYIDIELKAAENYLPDFAPAKTILSHHNFDEKPLDLQDIVNTMTKVSSEAIAKIAYKANSITDTFEALDLLKDNPGMIAIAMGYEGLMSRLLAGKLDSLLTFATLSNSESTADGQISLELMSNMFRVNSSDSKTKIYGIIGSPVSHSRSPEIHNRAFAHSKYNGMYIPLLIQPDEFADFMDNCIARPWLDFCGFSVTIPHKHNAIDYVKAKGGKIDPAAEKIGAANTVIISEAGEISCYNTDYYGALKAITDTLDRDNISLAGMKAAVIGAGGVSRAIVAALTDNGCEVTIYNRTVARAEKLAEVFGCKYAAATEIDLMDAKLIVNCTSMGMEPDTESSPVKAETLKADMTVFDTVYVPLETKLLKYAAAAGARRVSGLDMFINQAIKQYELFTDGEAPEETMSETVKG